MSMSSDDRYALPQPPEPEPSQAALHPRERRRATVAIMVSFLCAVFTGWYAWDTHQMRLYAEKASSTQAEEAKETRAASERSAQAAERSAGAAEQSIFLSRELVATWRGSASDARAVARLDLEPDVRVNATLYPIKTSTREIPPNIVVSNVGPVEAVQVKLIFIAMRRRGDKSLFAIHDSGDEWSIDSLGPGKSASFDLTAAVRGVAMVYPPEQHAVLLRAEWRRDPDRKLFRGFLIFPLSRDGRWVSDSDSSVKSDEYRATRELIEVKESQLSFDSPFARPMTPRSR
jgi:hypothetical protein